MHLTILSRASDLAVLQARMVADALIARWPDLAITLATRSAEGDRDRVTPLAAGSEKGLFTADLSGAIARGEADLAVHSWKDLPIETHPGTIVAGTLERADPRDVLLVTRDAWDRRPASLVVLTSSPRRAWQIETSISGLLPWPVDQVRTVPIRGNIPTRLRKLVGPDSTEGNALVVAKAAIDRLLSDRAKPGVAASVREAIGACLWMVLPLSRFPSAPAQGALAIEVATARRDLAALVRAISHTPTWEAVHRERAVLASYGGGCHAAIGATARMTAAGSVLSVRARLPDGVEQVWALDAPAGRPPSTAQSHVFPRPTERGLGTRQPVEIAARAEDADWWVTRAEAWPDSWTGQPSGLIWAAGPETWRRLAARGLWVHGCADGLGFDDPAEVDLLSGRVVSWRRLTHLGATDENSVPTYALSIWLPDDLGARTHFFWTSPTQLHAALLRWPEIRAGWHASGPGRTATAVIQAIGDAHRCSVWLTYDAWFRAVVGS